LPTFGVAMLIGCASFLEPSFLGRLYAGALAGPGPLKLVYDGLCPLCLRAASMIKALDVWNQVDLVDFNKVKPSSVHRRLDAATCMRAMQLVTPAGRLYSGFFAFRALACRLRTLWPLAPALYVPGVSSVGVRVYGFIAARRPRFAECPEGACFRHGSDAGAARETPYGVGDTKRS
jgi:predicted DCC family thiol-disulfide oxidoreductase YuxK